MKKYNAKKCAQIVKFFYQHQGFIILTKKAYRKHFQVRDAPTANTIRSIVRHFEEQGTASDLPLSGRPCTGITNETKQRVQESVEQNPGASTGKRPKQLGISRTSQRRALRTRNPFPDKVQFVQQLKHKEY